MQASIQATGQRAVIVSTLPETLSGSVRERLKAAGIAPMQGIEDCLFAIRAAANIGHAQENRAQVQPVLPNDLDPGEPALLDEWQSKALLEAAGIAIPQARLSQPDAVAAEAAALDYPLAVKGVAEGLAHKTEAGAVHVGIDDAEALAAAIATLAGRYDRILVEQMVAPVVAELIVGVGRDPTFGLHMLIGAGGVDVELLDDTVSLLLPVSCPDIVEALSRLKVSALLEGYRGRLPGDFEAAVSAIEAVAAFAAAHAATLHELDVNPLIVTPESAVAADALIRMIR